MKLKHTVEFMRQKKESILFITLDSCRYDCFMAAHAPHMKQLGVIHKAMSPGNFTFGSHAAMFMGFLPTVPERAEPYINSKYAKIFRMEAGGFAGVQKPLFSLPGCNIIDGFKSVGYKTIGTGSVGWFNPDTETGRALTEDFDSFYYAGNTFSLRKQLSWLEDSLAESAKPVFVFANIGETHVPYYYEEAPWDKSYNPCKPFSVDNSRDECFQRQKSCVEYIDLKIQPLLEAFSESLIIICADHGDCWGEDGLWEHGIYHCKVHEVPLIIKMVGAGKS